MWEGACSRCGGSVESVLADTPLSGASPLPQGIALLYWVFVPQQKMRP
ncbi:hypothetical protein C4J97_2976 [Pseudomonas orientalis]|nr:hypothetical protein C4J97_2976 [Pseudomonas orientalis]